MMQKHKPVGNPLPKGQLILILALGLLLSAYLITLISNYHHSQEELELAAIEQLRLQTESRAAELAYFFSDATSSLSTLSESRELSIYFANKALKMSMRYGLEANLISLRERLMSAVEEQHQKGHAIFSRIVFIAEQGELLADTGAAPATAQIDWATFLTPETQGAQLLSDSGDIPFLVSLPYFFKGKFKGQLLAWVSLQSMARHLATLDPVLQDAIYSWDGRVLAAGDRWNDLLPEDSEAASNLAIMSHGETLTFAVNAENGVDGALAVKVLLPGIDYYLVTLYAQDKVLSHATSQALLFAAGALPLLATIGFLIFLQLRHINETLRRRYLESLEQRRKLANEIVHRKAAEQELRDKQQQVLKASRELSETMAALQESQQMLSEAQRIAHVGSWNFTSRTNKLTWSDEVYRILGLEKKAAPPGLKLFLGVVHPDDRERVERSYIAAARSSQPWEIVHRIIRPNGVQRIVQQQAMHIRDPGGAADAVIIGVVYDITERTAAEAEQARLQRELEQAQKMEALGQLTGGIAHDFNNNLGVILGYTTLARELCAGSGQAKLDKYLEKVELASERTKELISQMLAFSRTGESTPKPLNLQQLVKEDLKLLRPTLPSSIEIRSRIDADLPPVVIDPVQVNQLLMNLSINARDAMGGVGVIDYRLRMARNLNSECSCCHRRVQGDWVELSVADTGAGIDRQIRNRLFEPFFTTKDVGKGTGMGLAVVHGIVSRNGGRILVESENGKGTRFRLLFPQAANNGTAVAEQRQLPLRLQRGTGQNILIVDDEPALAEYIAELLELYGYRTTRESSSIQALHLLQGNPAAFSLLITDQTMPRLTGLGLIDEARRALPTLPVILCSGFSEQIDKESAEQLGIRYLGKPIDPNSLILAVGELAVPPASTTNTERLAV